MFFFLDLMSFLNFLSYGFIPTHEHGSSVEPAGSFSPEGDAGGVFSKVAHPRFFCHIWVFLKTVYIRNEQNVTDLHRLFIHVSYLFGCNVKDTYVLRMTHIAATAWTAFANSLLLLKKWRCPKSLYQERDVTSTSIFL